MFFIDGMANIGKNIERAVVGTAKAVVGVGKYILTTPREIVQEGNKKVEESRLHGLTQAALYGVPENKANAVEILKKEYPDRYEEIKYRI